MRSLVASALTVSFAVHALLGCCAHHAHAAHVEPAMRECAEHGDHSHDDQGDQPCDEGECVFANGAARVILDSPLAPAFAGAILMTSAGDSSGVHLVTADDRAPPGGLELCILHQRLVI